MSVPTHGSLTVGLYCLALAPLLLALENTNWGYVTFILIPSWRTLVGHSPAYPCDTGLLHNPSCCPALLPCRPLVRRLGLRFPFDAWFVRSRFPLHALLYLGLGIYPCFAYPTVLGGVFMILTAITYAVASARQASPLIYPSFDVS